jgi:hypothetical protein
VQHFLNLFFMAFIIRAGIQVFADHPRLCWKRDCTPGTEWFRFQKAVPPGRIWTAKDDSVTLPGWLGTRRPSCAIQRSKASIQELASRYDLNPKTVMKWRKRAFRQ